MKTSLLAQQFSYFKKTGHLRLEDYPVEFKKIFDTAKSAKSGRDLWRHSPFLKKLILRGFGPIALELMKKSSLRLGCDQWIEEPVTADRLDELFCFQGVACIFFLTKSGAIDIFDAHREVSLLEEGYLVCFTFENAVMIDNPKDRYRNETKNLGYTFGDRLQSEFHPLVVLK